MDNSTAQEDRECCCAYWVCIDFPDGPVGQIIPDSLKLPDRRRAYLSSSAFFYYFYYHILYTFFRHYLFYLY